MKNKITIIFTTIISYLSYASYGWAHATQGKLTPEQERMHQNLIKLYNCCCKGESCDGVDVSLCSFGNKTLKKEVEQKVSTSNDGEVSSSSGNEEISNIEFPSGEAGSIDLTRGMISNYFDSNYNNFVEIIRNITLVFDDNRSLVLAHEHFNSFKISTRYEHFESFLAFAPEIFLASGILVLTLYGVSLSYNAKHKAEANDTFLEEEIHTAKNPLPSDIVRLICRLSAILVLLTIFLEVFIFSTEVIVPHSFIFSNKFMYDQMSVYFKIVLLLTAAICIILSERTIVKNEVWKFEYFIYLLSSVLGFMVLLSSVDFLTVYLAIEVSSLGLVLMAPTKTKSRFASEAAIKYFLVSSFASCVMVFGFSLIFTLSGSTTFLDIMAQKFKLIDGAFMRNNPSYAFPVFADAGGVALVCVGLFIKLGIAPFHYWVADTYEGAPLSTTIFYSIVPKLPLFCLLYRLVIGPFAVFCKVIAVTCLIFGVISIVLGTFGAIKQDKIKRLMAFSSVAHTGFILVAFSNVAYTSGVDVEIPFFYLFVYICSSFGLWSIFAYVEYIKENDTNLVISDLTSLGKINVGFGCAAVVLLLSSAGVPPFAGFYAKFLVVLSCMQNLSTFTLINLLFYGIIFVSVITTVFSTFYYIRILKVMFFEINVNDTPFAIHRMPLEHALIVAASVTLTIGIFWYPQMLIAFIKIVTKNI